MRPSAPRRSALRHQGWVRGVAWSTSLLRCSGPVSTRGRRRARCPPAAWVPQACCPRGALGLSPGRSMHPRPPVVGSFAASESQRADDLVCRVKRRRPGACFTWGRGFRYCCVAVPKSRGGGADFPWLVHVLWARWGVGGGARTLASRAGVCVLVWALGAPPVARVAWAAPLRGTSEVRRSPSPRCPPLGGLPVSAGRIPWAPVRGRGGPALSPWLACSAGGCVLLGWWGAVPWGWPSTAVRGVWCQALSLILLPVFWGWAARVPRPVCPGCSWCGCGDPAPAPQRVPLRAVVARCGDGERASPGGGACRRYERGPSSGAPTPPAVPPLGGP